MDGPPTDTDTDLPLAGRDGAEQAPAAGREGLDLIVSSLPVDHSGTTVHVQGWRFVASERHPLLIVHDLGEHSGHYTSAAEAFVAEGYSVYTFDLRGHGRSGRRLGHAPSFAVLVKDLLQVAAWVRHKENGRVPVILGHGVGALILVDFTKQYGAFCKAAILSAPCLELAAAVPTVTRAVLRLLADALPIVRLPRAISPKFARAGLPAPSGDLSVAEAPRLTAVFAHELLLAIKRVEARFIEYHGSVLILCPEQDSICVYHQLKKSAALHVEHNLLIIDLPDTPHEVFTAGESCRKAAFDVILPWLARTLAAEAGAPPLPQPPPPDAPRRGAASRGAKPGATKS